MKKELTKLTDDLLVECYAGGCKEAFEVLLERYQASLFTYIKMSIGISSVAEDIFQDTLVKVLDKLRQGQYSARDKFKSWLFRIAHNLIMDHFRREKVRNVISISENEECKKIVEQLPSDALNIEELIVVRNEKDEVRKWVSHLPKEQRDVVVMRYLYDMSFKEIATQTNVSISTALGRMRYALINLRKIRHRTAEPSWRLYA